LNTKYQQEDVDFCDFQPTDKKEKANYKYYCPICLRYFNLMLLSECCTNYICHLCIYDLKNHERKNPTFKAVCPYGCMHNGGDGTDGENCKKFHVNDVDPGSKVKKYSDS